MKYIFILGILLCLSNCYVAPIQDFELISYHGLLKSSTKSDTLIQYFKCHLYARFSSNGKCVLSASDKNEQRLFKDFIINENIMKDFMKAVKHIKSDTILVIKSNSSLYNGPAIRIFAYNADRKSINIGFDDSSRSNPDFRNFYNYIDSISLAITSSNYIDSTSLIKAQEKLLQSIYETDKRKFPIIIKADVEEE